MSLPNVIRALYGAYRLALFDTNGHSYFDTSITGFWRSFQAALLIAPLFLIMLMARFNTDANETSFTQYISLELSAYTLSWLVFPLVMEWLSRTIGCRDRYLGFIVAYNWAMVPQYLIFIVVISFGLIGVIPPELADSLSVILLVWTFFYAGFIAKSALEIPVQTAIGIVVLDFLLGLTLDLAITG